MNQEEIDRLEQQYDNARNLVIRGVANKVLPNYGTTLELVAAGVYQKMVKAGIREQIKKKYRTPRVYKGGKKS